VIAIRPGKEEGDDTIVVQSPAGAKYYCAPHMVRTKW
jgi:hypothetical protein